MGATCCCVSWKAEFVCPTEYAGGANGIYTWSKPPLAVQRTDDVGNEEKGVSNAGYITKDNSGLPTERYLDQSNSVIMRHGGQNTVIQATDQSLSGAGVSTNDQGKNDDQHGKQQPDETNKPQKSQHIFMQNGQQPLGQERTNANDVFDMAEGLDQSTTDNENSRAAGKTDHGLSGFATDNKTTELGLGSSEKQNISDSSNDMTLSKDSASIESSHDGTESKDTSRADCDTTQVDHDGNGLPLCKVDTIGSKNPDKTPTDIRPIPSEANSFTKTDDVVALKEVNKIENWSQVPTAPISDSSNITVTLIEPPTMPKNESADTADTTSAASGDLTPECDETKNHEKHTTGSGPTAITESQTRGPLSKTVDGLNESDHPQLAPEEKDNRDASNYSDKLSVASSKEDSDADSRAIQLNILVHDTSSTSSRAIDEFLEVVVMFQCTGSKSQISFYRVQQSILDTGYLKGVYQWHWNYTGSFAEGLPAHVCNDWDLMVTSRAYPVVLDKDSAKEDNCPANVVVPEAVRDQPIYIRLKREQSGTEQTQYLSLQTFFQDTKPVNEEPSATSMPVYEANLEDGTGEVIHCLHSPNWPAIANEYINRPRAHSWPPKSLVDKIVDVGCLVEGPQYPKSQCRDEWRWSFALAEKELVNAIDRKMLGCLYLMEAIKKRLWEGRRIQDKPPAICSYYLKSACLWISEMTPSYDRIGVIDLTRLVLDWLIQCYHKKYLSHYFVPEHNLISHLPSVTCLEMAEELQEVKSKLWLHILCSVEMTNMLKESLQSVQTHLNFRPVGKDKKEVMTALLDKLVSCAGASKLLNSVAVRAGHNSETYRQEELYWLGQWAAGYYPKFHSTMEDLLSISTGRDLINIPEGVLLPVLENLNLTLEPMFVPMFRSTLYRCLGQVYHGLSFHFLERQPIDSEDSDICSNLAHTCKKKALQYIGDGMMMSYPDWNDQELSGVVHLAKFHYLNGEMEKLAETTTKLRPLLQAALHSSNLTNGAPWLAADIRHQLSRVPWQQDQSFYHSMQEASERPGTEINAVVLGFYIQARLALVQGDTSLVEESVNGMREVRKSLLNAQQRLSTRALTSALCKEL